LFQLLPFYASSTSATQVSCHDYDSGDDYDDDDNDDDDDYNDRKMCHKTHLIITLVADSLSY